jgi:hypothetical protein
MREHPGALGMGGSGDSEQKYEQGFHRFLELRISSLRASITSGVLQWLAIYARTARISLSESVPANAGMSLG